MKGFEGAAAAMADEIVVFGAASEAFSQKNINCSIAESIERFAPVCEAARARGMRVRGSISCSLGCPYQGEVEPESVAYVARLMRQIGVHQVGVADTIGTGTPAKTQRVMEAVLKIYELPDVSGHFHDTYGQAVSNIYACLEMGIASFDTSVAGLGGCPYAKGATGNVATEDVLYLLQGLGIDTGIDLGQDRRDRAVDQRSPRPQGVLESGERDRGEAGGLSGCTSAAARTPSGRGHSARLRAHSARRSD